METFTKLLEGQYTLVVTGLDKPTAGGYWDPDLRRFVEFVRHPDGTTERYESDAPFDGSRRRIF